jgi:hypothetical protein
VYSCRGSERKELLASLGWREVAQALEDPALVVALTTFCQRTLQLFQVLKRPHHSNCSFKVRMNRSTQPLRSG